LPGWLATPVDLERRGVDYWTQSLPGSDTSSEIVGREVGATHMLARTPQAPRRLCSSIASIKQRTTQKYSWAGRRRRRLGQTSECSRLRDPKSIQSLPKAQSKVVGDSCHRDISSMSSHAHHANRQLCALARRRPCTCQAPGRTFMEENELWNDRGLWI